jgi:hypothetical protein
VLPNSHFFTQIRMNSRNFTLFRANSREVTWQIVRKIFCEKAYERLFLALFVVHTSKKKISWKVWKFVNSHFFTWIRVNLIENLLNINLGCFLIGCKKQTLFFLHHRGTKRLFLLQKIETTNLIKLFWCTNSWFGKFSPLQINKNINTFLFLPFDYKLLIKFKIWFNYQLYNFSIYMCGLTRGM